MKTEHSVVVEQVSDKDVPEFLRLVDALADYEKLARPDAGARERLSRDCLGPNRRIDAYLAWVGEGESRRAVGYLIVFETYSSFLALPSLYIEDIFVDPEARRFGVGRALFGYAVGEAERRGCGRVEFVVLDWNRLARDFYEKAGASELKDWVPYRIPAERFTEVVRNLGVRQPGQAPN